MRRPIALMTVLFAVVVAAAIVFLTLVVWDPARARGLTVEPMPEEQEARVEISTCLKSLTGLPPAYLSDERLQAKRLIVVFKRPYKIGLYHDGRLVVDYGVSGCFPISMGAWPYEPKYKLDWMSTPEGWYQVGSKHTTNPNDKYPPTSFYKAFLVNYPNLEDVDRALTHHVIDQYKAGLLRRFIKNGQLPPQHTPMGGEIMIHAWYTSDRAATEGGIGVDDKNRDWLFDRVESGDPILIVAWKDVIYTDGTTAIDTDVPEEPELITIDLSQIDQEASAAKGQIVMKPTIIIGNVPE